MAKSSVSIKKSKKSLKNLESQDILQDELNDDFGSSTNAEDDAAFELEKLKLNLQISEKKLTKMTDVENKLKEMKDQNRSLEEEVNKLKMERNSFETKSINLQGQIDDLIEDGKQKDNQNEKLNQQIEQHLSKQTGMKGDQRQLNSQISQLKNTISQLESKVKELEQEIANQVKTNEMAQSGNDQLLEKIMEQSEMMIQ